jgi:hypothetical protein
MYVCARFDERQLNKADAERQAEAANVVSSHAPVVVAAFPAGDVASQATPRDAHIVGTAQGCAESEVVTLHAPVMSEDDVLVDTDEGMFRSSALSSAVTRRSTDHPHTPRWGRPRA